MKDSLIDLLNFANEFADKSGKILKKKFEDGFSVEGKEDGSFVTEVDKKIEHLFLESIKKNYPHHGVIGEEFGNHNIKAKYIWIIDPLDGTHNFIAGKPLFGTLICLMIDKKASLGVLDIPILNERWYGTKGGGVKKNNIICALPKSEKKLSDVILSSTSLMMFDEKHRKIINDIYEKVKFPVFGTDCYAYGLFLSGKIDLIIEANMKPWDYMAQVALINEIGGIATDWLGKPLTPDSDGRIIVAKSLNCYNEVMKYLSKVK